MNRRKAGEDFYFLHKFIPLGQFDELQTTRVIPSPRISERVPFGTGRAVGTLINSKEDLTTYAPQSFIDLQAFFKMLPAFFKAKQNTLEATIAGSSEAIQAFLVLINFKDKLIEIRGNTNSLKSFEQRFFRWFNAFMIMKYLHFCRDNFYENLLVVEAARWLLKNYHHQPVTNRHKSINLLERFRELDKKAKKKP